MSYSITFNKAQNDDYTDPAYQDRITDSVWFTRLSQGNSGPLFNYKYYVDNEINVTKDILNYDYGYDGEGDTGGTKGVLWGVLSNDDLPSSSGLNPDLFSILGRPYTFYSFSQLISLLGAFIDSSSPPTSLVNPSGSREWNLQNGDTWSSSNPPILENKDLACYIPSVNRYFKIRISYWGIGNNGDGGAITYTRTPLFSASNICFAEHTLINVDQGIVPIQYINTKIHTINNKKIIAITRSVSDENYLVKFAKDALSTNYPNNVTIVSHNHKIQWRNKMLSASKFLLNFPGATRIPYDKEILYNILMETPNTVVVNNMVCETLDPSNPIAKTYKSQMDL